MSSKTFPSVSFINNTSTAVYESLLGLVTTNPHLGLFDYGKVVVVKNYESLDHVKVVSGGGSGHEPAFAGFVGKGMLTAAIQGDIFTSPLSSDILKTLREISGEPNLGILIIIPNNSGDRLNFGLAVERAQNEGIKVKLLIVSDDTTINGSKQRQRRGLCGAFLLQKIAAAMAIEDYNLEHVYSFCERLQKNLFSILLSIKSCGTVERGTCGTCKTLVGKNEMEIGAGLHGERGPMRMSVTPVEHVCKMMFEQLMNENNENKLEFERDIPVVLLVNNLGSTSQMEEFIFLKELVRHLQCLSVRIERLYHGKFLTSFDMIGFTVTILKVKDPKIVDYLDAPCDAPCWYGFNPIDIPLENNERLSLKVYEPETIEMRGPRLSKRQSNTLLLVVQFACDALVSCERQLNIIDSEAGDGDTGTRLKRGVDAINTELSKRNLNLNYPFVFLLSLSKLVESTMAGALGCIYSILFESSAKEFMNFPESHHVGASLWLHALKRATGTLATYTKVEEGDNTMYDSLCACVKSMEHSLDSGVGDVDSFGCGVSAAEEAAQRTKMHLKRYPDPGAHAVGIWMRAIYEGIKLRCE